MAAEVHHVPIAAPPPHPLGTRARVLLSSVFGPYAQDDEYGSRAVNPMELYHNQVTREQGVFSLRMFHRSWGLMLIQVNIEAPTALLDFPTQERFIEELRERRYDIVGISAIWPNLGKVARMCELVREHLPDATLVLGGHVANVPGLRERVGADYVVRGDGVRWFRRFLGQDEDARIRHPEISSAFGARTMGVALSSRASRTAATLIPSVGCPMGCNFCSTSAMFGGKGRSVSFFDTGEELYGVMCGLEARLGARSFFVMDENFLLHRKRALRLLELMRAGTKSWSLYVFSSVNALRRYSSEQLVELGVSWIWVGLEGEGSDYAKLERAETCELVDDLQSHGIRVLASSIVGLLEHTPENIDAVIDHAASHAADFHQFMLYTPVPGTPLHREQLARGTLLDRDQCPDADAHGQHRFNFVHPHIPAGFETEYLRRAFQRDFQRNGPSVLRIAGTLLRGWRRHKAHPSPRVRARIRRECSELSMVYPAALWAAQRRLRGNPRVAQRLATLRVELEAEFGWVARASAPLLGRWMEHRMTRESERLKLGWTYEPKTFYEVNAPALTRHRTARCAGWVTPAPSYETS